MNVTPTTLKKVREALIQAAKMASYFGASKLPYTEALALLKPRRKR